MKEFHKNHHQLHLKFIDRANLKKNHKLARDYFAKNIYRFYGPFLRVINVILSKYIYEGYRLLTVDLKAFSCL